jgi:murein DD-endopeptidase MepM/ murein hydrolase activator NlpD
MYKQLIVLLLSFLSIAVLPVQQVVYAEAPTADELQALYYNYPYYDNSEVASSCVDPSDPGTTNLNGRDNVEKAFNFFKSKGFSPQQAAGIIGNFIQESHLDPKIQQDGSNDKFPKNGVGFGIAQWTFTDRQAPLVALAKKENLPVTSLAVQLDYVWQELTTGYKDTVASVKRTSSVEAAVSAFMNGYERPGDPQLANRIQYAKTTLAKYGGGATNNGGAGDTATSSADTTCSSGVGGLGINGDFVFPEKTTQAAIKNVKGTTPWCYKSQTNCHHDYAAADIFNAVGTTVVAAVSGKVLYVKDPGGCDGWRGVPHLQIKGTDGKGRVTYYYYTHMMPGSLAVHGGDTVKAGDVLGKIGPTQCAQGTAPHLHFQMSEVQVNNTSSPSEQSRYINPQPNLVAAFAKLPES